MNWMIQIFSSPQPPKLELYNGVLTMLQSPITIEELLTAKEGEEIQFKEAKRCFDSNEAARICCALANCGGVKLVFSISDKRPRQVVGSMAFDQD